MAEEPDYERIRQIGELGENFFERLCIKAKVNKSKPGYDSMGWDFFVEIPPRSGAFVYADARPGATRVLVQVKSTDRLGNSLDTITVRNHEHLAKAKMPTFVFILDFGGKDEPQTAYLCHYDVVRIGATLRKLRELESQGKSDTNNHKMVLKPYEDDLLDLASSDLLIPKIWDHVGSDENTYIAKKRELLETLGFENGVHRLSFATRISLNEMADALLGLRPIEIEDSQFADIRFDIELGTKDFGSGTLQVDPQSVGNGLIEVRRKGRGNIIRMITQLYFVAIPGYETETASLRASGCVTNMILRGKTWKAHFLIDYEKEYPVFDLLRELEFWAATGEKGLSISIYKDNSLLGRSAMMETVKVPTRILRILDDVRAIANTIRDNDLANTFKVSLKAFDESKELMFWLRLASQRKGTRFTGELDYPSAVQVHGRKGIYYMPIVLKSSTQTLIVFSHWQAKVSSVGNQIVAKLSRGNIWGAMCIDENYPDEQIKDIWSAFKSFCSVGKDEVTIQRDLVFLSEKTEGILSNDEAEDHSMV